VSVEAPGLRGRRRSGRSSRRGACPRAGSRQSRRPAGPGPCGCDPARPRSPQIAAVCVSRCGSPPTTTMASSADQANEGGQAGAGSTGDMSDPRHATRRSGTQRVTRRHQTPNLAGPALKHGRHPQAHTHRHATGTPFQGRLRTRQEIASDLQLRGAGDRDRTGMTSLEGCGQYPSDLLRPRSGHVHQSP
jgi:hypothetical protein